MQTATSETVIKSLDLSIGVHHYTLRAPCPKGQENTARTTSGWPEMSYPAGWMAVVHLFCTVVLVGIGQNWGDCNRWARNL